MVTLEDRAQNYLHIDLYSKYARCLYINDLNLVRLDWIYSSSLSFSEMREALQTLGHQAKLHVYQHLARKAVEHYDDADGALGDEYRFTADYFWEKFIERKPSMSVH